MFFIQQREATASATHCIVVLNIRYEMKKINKKNFVVRKNWVNFVCNGNQLENVLECSFECKMSATLWLCRFHVECLICTTEVKYPTHTYTHTDIRKIIESNCQCKLAVGLLCTAAFTVWWTFFFKDFCIVNYLRAFYAVTGNSNRLYVDVNL